MEQPGTIGLAAAQDRARRPGCRITIEESPRGFLILVDGEPINSRRRDVLSFLTVDGAFNYASRHLATPAGRQVRLLVELHDG